MQESCSARENVEETEVIVQDPNPGNDLELRRQTWITGTSGLRHAVLILHDGLLEVFLFAHISRLLDSIG